MSKDIFMVIYFLILLSAWIFYLSTLILYMSYLRNNNYPIWKKAKNNQNNFFRVQWYVNIYYLLGLTFKSTKNVSFRNWKKIFFISFILTVMITVSFLIFTYSAYN
jgi:hypothetical protein